MYVRTAGGTVLAVLTGVALVVPSAVAQERPIYVRPGAPGEPTQRISPRDLEIPQMAPYSQAEVEFMQHMMVHHAQAVRMSELVPERAADERVRTFARRIDLTQDAEIAQMAQWLRHRGEHVPDPHDTHGHEGMPGMISEEQMAELEAATGAEFDELFLELMIQHHFGALTMIDNLVEATGGVLEANVSAMTVEMADEQDTEIKRMRALLEDLRS